MEKRGKKKLEEEGRGRVGIIMLNKWWEAMLELVYPGTHTCIFCWSEIPGQRGSGVCQDCSRYITSLGKKDNTCDNCGHFTLLEDCPNCQGIKFPLDKIFSVVPYEGIYRELIQKLKYGGEKELATPLGYLMACKAQLLGITDGIDAIIPVPLHRTKEEERGFNQSLSLAKEVRRELGIPVRDILLRTSNASKQSSLGRRDRFANIEGVFAMKREEHQGLKRFLFKEPGHGLERVLLVDDVVTTGATLCACAHVLRTIGVKRILALTWTAGFDKNLTYLAGSTVFLGELTKHIPIMED